MAKTRAQRKAEQRKREERRARKAERAGVEAARDAESDAQEHTQVPESADVLEAELAERGADLEALKGTAEGDGDVGTSALDAPAPSRADVGAPAKAADADVPSDDRISRRARKRAERERKQAAKESQARRKPREEPAERQRGRVIGFIVSCWAELKRVQWPDRPTLIQASAVTIIFIAIAAAYLGLLDLIFNWIVQRII